VALLATDAGHKTNTAGIALGRRIIETLRRRQTVVCLPMLQKKYSWLGSLAFVVGLLGGELRHS
jgi:hypothetical protein